MKSDWRLCVLWVLVAGCKPGGDVPIGLAPRAPVPGPSSAADVPTASDTGVTASLSEPPGLLEGLPAETLRAVATGAVVEFDQETDIFTFVPVDAAGREAAVRLSPATLAGWGSGPQPLVLDAFSPSAGAAFLFRGVPSRQRVDSVIGKVVEKAAVGGRTARTATGTQALAAPAPSNGLYRVHLDGVEADAPRPVAVALSLAGERARSEATGQYFLTLDAGLAVLPDAGAAVPRLFRPNPPGGQYGIVGLSEAAGRLVFTEADVRSGLPKVERVWSVPFADVDAEPTSVYRFPPVSASSGAVSQVHRLDDRWFVATGGDDTATVLDATGEVPSLPLGGTGRLDGPPLVVGETLVFARAGPDENGRYRRQMFAQRLGVVPPASRVTLNTGESFDLKRGIADAQGTHLAFGRSEGALVVPLDGGAPSLLSGSPDRAGTAGVGFSPDGQTVLLVTEGKEGLGLEALPRSGGPGRVLVAPEQAVSAIDLAGVETRGHFVVLRETAGTTTLARVGLDGAAGPPVALSGHSPRTRLVPGGLVVTTRGGGHHVDAVTPAGLEPRFTARGEVSFWGVVPGGAFALAVDRRFGVLHKPTPAAIDLRHAGPSRALIPAEGTWSLDALRSDAVTVSRRDDLAEGAALVPLAAGFDAAQVYATTGGRFSFDLPALGGAAFIVDDFEASRRTVIFAPDGGEAPQILATLESRQVRTLLAETETRTVVALVGGDETLGEDADELVRWPLEPVDGADAEPVGVALPGIRTRTLDALPSPGTYLVSGEFDGQSGLWRLAFGAGAANQLNPIAPAGLGLPSPSLAAAFHAQEGAFDANGAGDFFSADRTLLLAAGPRERGEIFALRTLYVVHLDGRDRDGVEPLFDGLAVVDGSARMVAEGRHVIFASREGQGWVAAARAGGPAHVLGALGSSLGRRLFEGAALMAVGLIGGASVPPLALSRGGSLVFLDEATGELAVIDPAGGSRTVRASFTSPGGTGRPELLRLTPDERAAVVAWSGPTGRRLYVVSLEGEPAIARLVADEAPANEKLLAFPP